MEKLPPHSKEPITVTIYNKLENPCIMQKCWHISTEIAFLFLVGKSLFLMLSYNWHAKASNIKSNQD
jgi:hypothetical protein